jgi:nucleoside-diphosphate-sugar epimerase
MIFVTGGTGFLGKNLIPCLAAKGHRIRVLVRQPEAHPWLSDYDVEIVQGTLADAPIIERAVTGCQYVVHAGGLFRMWGQAAAFERANIQGTMNVIEAALKAGAQRYVHISTIAVVGNPTPGRIIDETHPANPADPYQKSKLVGEHIVQGYVRQHGLPAIILRPGAFYGPHGRYAFNRLFFEDPLKGLRIKVAHGRHIIFPVYIGDVAETIDGALRCGRVGEIYNVCGEPLTHNQANDIISEEAGISHFRINAPTWAMITLARVWTWLSEYTGVEPYYPINLRSYVFNDWQASSEKARDELGFRPTPFREGVRKTLAWYREQHFPWAK